MRLLGDLPERDEVSASWSAPAMRGGPKFAGADDCALCKDNRLRKITSRMRFHFE